MMENATSVFGDYDQFTESNIVSIKKSHYYPSNNKELDENSKEIGLTQKYVDAVVQYENPPYATTDMPQTFEGFLSFIETVEQSSGSSKYDESWPLTEQSSSRNHDESSINVNLKSKEHSIEDFLEKHSNNQENHGSLSKFVQRFREQQPQSRNERHSQRVKKAGDFWWHSSTPLQDISNCLNSRDSSTISVQPNSVSLSPFQSDGSSVSTSTRTGQKSSTPKVLSEEDSAIARMQLRTDKLLLLSDNAVKDTTTTSASSKCKPLEPAKVEGRGFVVRDEGPSRHSNANEETPIELSRVSKPLKPENDILYKWRLSRKMDVAAKAVSSAPNPFLNQKKDVTKQDLFFDQNQDTVGSKERVSANGNTNDVEKACDTVNNSCACHLKESRSKTCVGCQCSQSKPAIKQQHTGYYNRHQPDVCCKENNQIKCNCDNDLSLCYRGSPSCCNHDSSLCRCNNHSSNLPLHVHRDTRDILPCVHNKESQRGNPAAGITHYNGGKVLDVQDIVVKGENKKHSHKSGMKKEAEELKVTSTTNVISQVVGNHLFDGNCTIVDTCTSVDGIDDASDVDRNGNINLQILPDDASSSEDEFHRDEILSELRNRKRNTKAELKMVDECLKRIQEPQGQRSKHL